MTIREILEEKLQKGQIDPLTFFKANVQYTDILEKGLGDRMQKNIDKHGKKFAGYDKGEGSKGGHVIGHTRSGKAIYSHFDHKDHKEFTASDHADAANAHKNKADEHHAKRHEVTGKSAEEKQEKYGKHMEFGAHHTVQSYKHEDAAENKSIKSGDKVKVKNTGRSGVAHYKNYEGHYVKFNDGSDGHFQEHHLEKRVKK